MQHKYQVGDRVRPAGGQGPLMIISCQVTNTTLFEKYFRTARYLCVWEGCSLTEGKRLFTENELEFAEPALQPAGHQGPETDFLFV